LPVQGAGRLEQPPAVAERGAELPQVGVGQLGQDVQADVVGAEGVRVPLQARAAQPALDVHAPPPWHAPGWSEKFIRISSERTMNRHTLTDREWGRLAPLLPPRPRKGRPPKDHRTVLDALLWLGRTGAPWRDLPERYGPWQTVATRFYRWTRSGLWDRILAELRRIADAAGGIDWDMHMVDGTNVRAHRCAAGGKGGRECRRWAAAVAGSAASCTSAATAGAGRWRSC
jgi:transposase